MKKHNHEYNGSAGVSQPKTGQGVHCGKSHEVVVKGVATPAGAKKSDKSAYQFNSKEYTGHPNRPWVVREKE